MNYDQNGNYMALAGLVVVLAQKFGLVVTQNDVLSIIGGLLAIYGIFTQWKAHKSLAISAGAIPSTSK